MSGADQVNGARDSILNQRTVSPIVENTVSSIEKYSTSLIYS